MTPGNHPFKVLTWDIGYLNFELTNQTPKNFCPCNCIYLIKPKKISYPLINKGGKEINAKEKSYYYVHPDVYCWDGP